MKRSAQLAGSTCIAITLFLSGKLAHADLTPPASCASTAFVDDACTTSSDEPGTCIAVGDCEVDSDGQSPNGCLTCELGAPPPKDAGTDAGFKTTTTTTSSSSSSGCTASPDAREGTVGLVMLAFGFLGLLVSRKKSA